MKTRIGTTKIDKLGDNARRIIAAGFMQGKTCAAIQRDVAEMFGLGKDVPRVGAVTAEVARMRSKKRRISAMAEFAQALLEAAQAVPGTPAQLLMALATQSLFFEPEKFQEQDPLIVQQTNLEAQKVQNKTREVVVKERAVAVLEKKQDQAVKRDRKAEAERRKAGKPKQLTPERIVEIEEKVFGL